MTGAVLAGPDGEVPVRARRGVLLAAGGFPNDVGTAPQAVPADPDRRGALDPRARRRPPATGSRSASPPGAVRHEAGLAGRMVSGVVGALPQRRVGTYPHIVDRGKPGLIAVLSNGKRFVNEADGYYQFTAR